MRLVIIAKHYNIHQIARELFMSKEISFRSLCVNYKTNAFIVNTKLSDLEILDIRKTKSHLWDTHIQTIEFKTDHKVKVGDLLNINSEISFNNRGNEVAKKLVVDADEALERFLDRSGLTIASSTFNEGAVCHLMKQSEMMSNERKFKFMIRNRFKISAKLKITDLDKFLRVLEEGLFSCGSYGHGSIQYSKIEGWDIYN